MRSLGDARAAPGEIAVGRLPVGETRDGAAVGLPVAVCNGAEDGETLYVQAASDGDELNGVGVVKRLFTDLDPTEVSGTILAVGVVNVHGFRTAQHRNPIDDTKLNRAYPGDDRGTTSERIAATTFEAATRADYALDLHQGSTSRMIEETRVRCGRRHRLHDECLELARVFDAGFVLDQKGPDGQLARVLPDEGVPTIDPELGGTVGWDAESIERGLDGVYNVLAHYGFLDGESTPATQVRASEFEQYVAPAGGLVSLECALGDRVVAGDELFRVTGVFGEEKETVSADADGIFWRSRRLPQVASGEYVCSVATGIDEC
jgi:predicted deacylase